MLKKADSTLINVLMVLTVLPTLLACTKEKLVAFVLVCDKTGKIIDFAISPLQADAKK